MAEFANPSFLVENKDRAERWKHLIENTELEDSKRKYDRLVLETVLDNTKRWIDEESRSSAVGAMTTYAFPLVRRVFPNLIANELVSVQPLSQPSGMIFYLDFKYGTTKAPTAKGDRIDYQEGSSKFNSYFGSGMVRGEVAGTGDGSNKAFGLDYYPVVEDSLVVYVNSVATTAYELSKNDGTGATVTMTSAPADKASVTVDYNVDTEGLGKDGNLVVPEIDFAMTSDTIGVETKKLKAKWSLEAQQDLMAYHGLDAESELVTVLGDELRREIDRQILTDLYASASAANVTWNYTMPAEFAGSQKDYDETIWNAIIDVNTAIFKKRLKDANWIVTSPDICARLEKLNGFKLDPGADTAGGTIQTGLQFVGSYKGRFKVYKDPMAPATKMLIGYKGSSFLETGYIYAPYVPIYTTPLIVDPNDFTPRRGVMSRFGRKLINGAYYGTVTVTA